MRTTGPNGVALWFIPRHYGIAMVRLTRTVRFNVDGGAACADGGARAGGGALGVNGFGGVPAMEGLGAHYELVVEVAGEPSRATGYLINIKEIDRAVRDSCVPIVARAMREGGHDMAGVLADLWAALVPAISVRLCGLRWRLTPYLSLEQGETAGEERAMGTSVILRQQFDLAAAHRLNSQTLSNEENRRLFGKCNNPNGHGHNYRVEAAFEVAGAGGGKEGVSAGELERLVQESIIERYDHKHLNMDCPEFDEARGGVNPTVEHIARVFFERLAPRVVSRGAGGDGARGTVSLRSVTVWETDRTSATYPG